MARRDVVGVVAALVLAAGATGCSETPTEVGRSRPAPHKGKLSRIVYVNPLPSNPFWDRIGTHMKAAAAKRGISVEEVGPAGGNVNVQAMHNLIAQAVAGRAQAIATWSLGGAAAFDPLFARAREQGGVVATLLSPRATKNQNFDVGPTWDDYARIQVRAIAKLPGDQRIGVIFQRPGGPGYADYAVGLKDEVSKHRDVTLVDLQYNYGRFTNDVTIAGAMLTTHPEINVLVNYSGFPGMLTAIREKHQVGKVLAFMGHDFPEAMLGYIDEGLIGGVFVQDTRLMGRTVVEKFLDLWAGKPVAERYGNGARIVSGEEFKKLPKGFV